MVAMITIAEKSRTPDLLLLTVFRIEWSDVQGERTKTLAVFYSRNEKGMPYSCENDGQFHTLTVFPSISVRRIKKIKTLL